jgi:1-acyl-sn-glycerol-3-phosphate acyltransferase
MTLFYRTIRGAFRVFFKVYGRCEVIGKDRIPKTGPVILVSNHSSYLDPPLLGGMIDRECAFLGRHDLWDHKWLGFIISRLNTYPVNRDNPGKSVFRYADDALGKGLVFGLFPEGGRSDDGKLMRGEMGVAHIVKRSGAPVVPAALVGPQIMLPVGASRLKRTKLIVEYGDPLFFSPDTRREEIVHTIMSRIAALMTKNGLPTVAVEDQEAAT